MEARAFSVRSGGATLVGEWSGDRAARPLVLIHGFGGSRHDWKGARANLPSDVPILAYDQRGFGDSIAPEDEAYSHANDLLALLDALDLTQVDLCGMSLGGATALNFALDHPERVRRLVLVSPLIVAWSWSDEWIELWKAIGRKARAGNMAEARNLWWRHPLFDEVRNSPAAAEVHASIDAFSGRQWIADPQQPELPDVDRLHALTVPTLLLTGEQDLADFRLIAKLIEAAAPDVTRIDYPGAGHILNHEKPAEVAQDVARFLASPQNL